MVSIVDLNIVSQADIDSGDYMIISNLNSSPASSGKVSMDTLSRFFNAGIGNVFITQNDLDSALAQAIPTFTLTAGSKLTGGGILDSINTSVVFRHDSLGVANPSVANIASSNMITSLTVDSFGHVTSVVESDQSNVFLTSVGVFAGAGLSGGGTKIPGSGSITISHPTAGGLTSTTNTGGTIIQNLTFDAYGHTTNTASLNIDSDFVQARRPYSGIFTVAGANGTSYTFNGDGNPTTSGNNPTLYMTRGQHYKIENSSHGSHPLYIKTAASAGTSNQFNDGVSGQGVSEVLIHVPHDAPSKLYYQCSIHPAMLGEIVILEDPGSAFVSMSGQDSLNPINGDIHISGELKVSGNITAFASFSDIRLKENIELIDDALNRVDTISGYTFNYIDNPQRMTGLIAQEVEKVLPEAVYEDGNHKALYYGNIVGLLVEAIKDLKKEVDEIKHRLE